MLLCFSCKQGWVPVLGIKLWKLIDLINNSHKRHDAHMRIHIHMHETQIRIYIHKIRFTNAKHNSQMYNCVQNFEFLKFTSVSWTVNVQIVFRVWIALDLCVCISETFMAARFSNVGHSYSLLSLANQMQAHHSTNHNPPRAQHSRSSALHTFWAIWLIYNGSEALRPQSSMANDTAWFSAVPDERLASWSNRGDFWLATIASRCQSFIWDSRISCSVFRA